MTSSQSPFRGQDEDEIYDAILADEPFYPEHMPKDAVNLIRKLLVRKPEDRLGYHGGAREIMDHEFFSAIEWDALYRKEVTPPFKPRIKDKSNLSNFDADFTSVAPCLTPVQSGISTSFSVRLCEDVDKDLSLESGDAGRIQGFFLQQCLNQTTILIL